MSNIKVHDNSVSGECCLPDLYMASFFVCPCLVFSCVSGVRKQVSSGVFFL